MLATVAGTSAIMTSSIILRVVNVVDICGEEDTMYLGISLYPPRLYFFLCKAYSLNERTLCRAGIGASSALYAVEHAHLESAFIIFFSHLFFDFSRDEGHRAVENTLSATYARSGGTRVKFLIGEEE